MPLLTLTEVKDHLNITGTGSDAELTTFAARAEGAVAARCGPLVSTSVTTRVRGHGSSLAPKVTPILTLTSVTPVAGTALTLALLHTPENGLRGRRVIEFLDGTWFGSRWYDVVYNAGHGATAGDVPADLKLATLEMVRHMWETQRGGSVRPGSRPSEAMSNTIPGAAYLFPFRVEQLIAPYEQVWL